MSTTLPSYRSAHGLHLEIHVVSQSSQLARKDSEYGD